MSMPGIVYLVGAGPGDPDLITVRGLRALRGADLVAYDRLVHPDLLLQAPESAQKIYVGKAPGRQAFSQSEINQLLVVAARGGNRVVRLKGGDPFVFGRGAEEAEALHEAGIQFEVIPGITSALAAPASAGIPVTHRDVARSFAVVTGHTTDPDEEPDWGSLARIDTLVILMGVGRLQLICERLQQHGLPSETPVAVVRSATTAAQVVVTGDLSDIPTRAAGITPPAVIVIGEVVRMRHRLAGMAGDRRDGATYADWPAAIMQSMEAVG